MANAGVGPVVSAAWLKAHLGEADLQVIDGSWHLPVRKRDAAAEYVAGHIPGAIPLDIDTVADPAPPPPGRMLPSAERFAEQVGLLGLRPEAHLVVYDAVGMYSSARVWWMFRTFGHRAISVLEGGLPAWNAAGGPMESGAPRRRDAVAWPVRPANQGVRDWRAVLRNIETREAQLVDVRPPEQFRGSTAANYPGVRDGHIPGAISLPRNEFLLANDTFPPPEAIENAIRKAGVDPDRPIIASCGSGVTACILALALELTGRQPCAVYDGSWEEWGHRSDLPATTD
ncbi:sulfurtransferase [Bosea minatitlanensis]|uniref:Sulfurtransferase n=1 Tax=Bosea minatitlanensis TaxID=128782 RepID=A0ABW0F6V8_9HYPH|nr:rhodanese-like domain-containing protein [Bosea minatitlanensis]MCT4493393.1 rhodanese-like domain-containing protein [Bosea minatitlanensis]